MALENLSPPAGARHAKKRLGRGMGSGHGKTCGKGHKGQNARSGGKTIRGFEGGQMPLQRRVPKRGFRSRNRVEVVAVNLRELNRFAAGSTVDLEALRGIGLAGKGEALLKILAEGELEHALTVRTNRISQAAQQKIEAAGGKVELV
ncbi:MAG: 50S ribosomal protein L15 [Myxococcota bacterium]|jgi:large subunit ribosomal protein L15|nr:50S ribosomal protein L15 [Myxococcota bacterium]